MRFDAMRCNRTTIHVFTHTKAVWKKTTKMVISEKNWNECKKKEIREIPLSHRIKMDKTMPILSKSLLCTEQGETKEKKMHRKCVVAVQLHAFNER